MSIRSLPAQDDPMPRSPKPLLAALLLVGGLGAQTIAYQVPLEGSQQVPPVATAGSGVAMLSLDILAGIVTVTGSYASLNGNQTVAHIHGPAPAGANQGVVLPLDGTGGTSGTFSGTGLLSPAQIADMRAGLHYVNIHSAAHPGGELRGQICLGADVATRAGLPNPQSYTASPVVFGGTFQATVDLTTTGHGFALLIGLDTAFDFVLSGGQRLLCLDLGGGEVFTGAGLGPLAGPVAAFDLPVPQNLALCNFTFSSQAIHFGGGVTPFALSNAQDLTLGF